MGLHYMTARRVFGLSLRTFTPLTSSTATLLQVHLSESSSSSSNLKFYSKLNARAAPTSADDDYDHHDHYDNDDKNRISHQTQMQTFKSQYAIVEQRHPRTVLNAANNTNVKVSENETLNRVNNVSTTPSNNTSINNNNNKNTKDSKPTLEQLLHLKQVLTNFLPKFLTDTHPYVLYSPDVIFENYYSDPPKITIGLGQYAFQLLLIRFKVNWKLTYAKMHILKITHDEKEGTIKIRWRINGVRATRTFFQPWKIKVWKIKETIKENDNEENWIDGFSIVYVRGDGAIYKHRVQRVMGQKDEEVDKVKNTKKILSNVAAVNT